jgi:hypothetical protein
VAALGTAPSLGDLEALLARDSKRSVACSQPCTHPLLSIRAGKGVCAARRLDHVSLTAFLEQLGRAARSAVTDVQPPPRSAPLAGGLNDIAAARASAAEADELSNRLAVLAGRLLTVVRQRLLWYAGRIQAQPLGTYCSVDRTGCRATCRACLTHFRYDVRYAGRVVVALASVCCTDAALLQGLTERVLAR